jgi:hypothetical protein
VNFAVQFFLRMAKWVQRAADSGQNRLRTAKKRAALWRATTLLHGPNLVLLSDDECCVVTLVKNGAFYLPELLAHHRAIGAKHFLFIDNGSSDKTVELAASQRDVTLVENKLPVAEFEVLMRSLLPRRFVRGGWFVFVDSDEMYDPPPGCKGKIKPLLRYMNARGYTAALGHCLDMFSDEPANVTACWSYAEALRNCALYSLAKLQRIDYHDPGFYLSYFLKGNRTDAPLNYWRGGMRCEVFGEEPLLTRHNVVRNAPSIVPLSQVHTASGVYVADVTASFRHYKFAGDYIGRDRIQVSQRVWAHGEDTQRLARYDQKGTFSISTRSQQTYRGVAALAEEGFIQRSERFDVFLARDLLDTVQHGTSHSQHQPEIQ